MIYVVKCYYCEHEFKVKRGENGADIMCPECGKANNINDVIERIDEATSKNADSDLSAIKDFDMSKNPVQEESYWDRYLRWKTIKLVTYYIMGILIGVLLVFSAFADLFKMIFK